MKATINNKSHINYVSYFLTLTGYMTLTISMPLINNLSASINLPVQSIQLGISLLFLTFSISSIILATLSDIFGSYKILTIAQLVSMIGLLVLANSFNYPLLLLGFFLVGLGTGCYSSISRSLLSRHVKDKNKMKKAFALLSACVISAPVIASFMARFCAIESWRIAYFLMAILELFLFIFARPVLNYDRIHTKNLNKNEIFFGFKHVFSKWSFILNILLVSMVFSVYLGVITENVQPLMLLELHITDHLFNIIFVLISVCYLIGIFIYRSYADIASKMHYRLIALLAGLLCIIYLSFASFTLLNIAISLLVLCLIMGFIVPLSTGSAMAVIEFGHGTAAATLTFSVSMIMAIWSFIQAHSNFSIYHFLMLSLWVTFIIVGIFKSILCIAEIKTKKMQLNLNKA